MLTGILAGLGAGALWGLVFVAPRMVAGFSGLDLTAGRFLVYGLVSVAALTVSWRHARKPTGSQALAALGLSVLGFTGYYWVLVLAIRDAGTEMPRELPSERRTERDQPRRKALALALLDHLGVGSVH